MASTLPINIPIPAENSITTYDWTDIADGTGIVKLYGFGLTTSSGTTRVLNNQLIKTSISSPNDAESRAEVVANGTAYGTAVELSLSAFNTPRVIKGTCTVAFSFGTGMVVSNGGIKIEICKNSTALANVETATLSTGTNAVYTYTMAITVPQTSFKIGDILSFKVYAKGEDAGHTNLTVYLAHDPSNRDKVVGGMTFTAATNHTDLLFFVPFKINL